MFNKLIPSLYVATDVEGIFRLSGSAKRIKDLQNIFNTPEKYGKGLDWSGYTVHDAAAVLRRYLNQLPEPIIPLEYYDRFRAPLGLSHPEAIKVYKKLIGDLPPLNRQLLLYILDLLAVFASKSEQNLMTSQNLSAIFQPGLISHPSHDMSPEDYRISQDVLVFLIENQDHFLMGMKGNSEGDESPLPPNTPSMHRRSVVGVSRTPSNASAAADTLRSQGGIRRNLSVSSRRSIPGSPKGISRSNTLPSRRSPVPRTTILRPGENPQMSSPSLGTTSGGIAIVRSPSSGGHMTENVSPVMPTAPTIPPKDDSSKPVVKEAPVKHTKPRSPDSKLDLPDGSVVTESTLSTPATTPSRERSHFLSPTSDIEKSKPNKLRRRRIPGSANHSAESSTTSLPNQTMQTPHPTPETILEIARPPAAAQLPRENSSTSHINFAPQVPPSAVHAPSKKKEDPTPASSGTGLAAISPSHSASSSLSSRSGAESKDYKEGSPEHTQKRRSRWRISVGRAETPPVSPPLGPVPKSAPHANGDVHYSYFGSSPPQKRDESRDRELMGPIQWIHKQMSSKKHHDKDHVDKGHRGGNEGLLASPPRTPHFGAVSQVQPPPPILNLSQRKGDETTKHGNSETAEQAR